jgi:lipooligosaccharide transport system ATP-binding protein
MEEAERLCDRLAILDAGRIVASGTPRALIAEHIEPHVVELTGAGTASWEPDTALEKGLRVHRVGDLTLIYTAAPRALLEQLDATDQRYLHRPANLEDVFLKLTGHDLRD